MRVLVKDWGSAREMDLSDALTPTIDSSRTGIAEGAQMQADAASKAVGILAALLVERGVIGLDDATTIVDGYGINIIPAEVKP